MHDRALFDLAINRKYLTKLVPMLEAVHDRLCGVHIERLRYDAVIRRYEPPGALFYLDPRCWGRETDYGQGVFAGDDFAVSGRS